MNLWNLPVHHSTLTSIWPEGGSANIRFQINGDTFKVLQKTLLYEVWHQQICPKNDTDDLLHMGATSTHHVKDDSV